MRSDTVAIDRAAEALFAEAPFPGLEDGLMLFGQFVGTWAIDWRGQDGEGNWRRAEGEWHFAWVLEGRAVQDIWIVPSRLEREQHGHTQGEYGTTLRVYDPNANAWNVTWNGPVYASVRSFVARREGAEIVMRGTDAEGHPMHWIFSDITPESFHWRSVRSTDGGETWEMREEMFVHRV
jgi:hypothetical protein